MSDMGRRRPSGDGMVRKRGDGRREGRIVVGHKENGDPIFRYVYGKTQKELLEKLHRSITVGCLMMHIFSQWCNIHPRISLYPILPLAAARPRSINSCCVYRSVTPFSFNIMSIASIPTRLLPSTKG